MSEEKWQHWDWTDQVADGWLRATFEYPDGSKRVIRPQQALFGEVCNLRIIAPDGTATTDLLADKQSAVSLMRMDDADLRADDERLTVKECAHLVKLSTETLYRYIRKEQRTGERSGPPWHEHPAGSGRYYYWRNDVLRWLQGSGKR